MKGRTDRKEKAALRREERKKKSAVRLSKLKEKLTARAGRIILAVLFGLSLLAISFYGGSISYGFFFSVLLVAAVGLLQVLLILIRFRIYQEIGSVNVVARESVPYRFVLQNEDLFAFSQVRVHFFSSFSTIENLPENLEYELLPGDQYSCDTRMVCRYRGEYEVGAKEVTVSDFLRLFRLKYKVPGTVKLTVLPRIPDISEVEGLEQLTASIQREMLSQDTEPDALIRDYIRGDALKRIHWKASARTRELKVRNEISEEREGLIILTDTKRTSKDIYRYIPAENKLLETVLGLGFFFAKKNIPFAARFGDGKEQNVSGMNDFDRFYRGTAGIGFSDKEDFSKTAGKLVSDGSLLAYKLVVFAVQEISEELLLLTEALSSGGRFVLILAVLPPEKEVSLPENSERRVIVRLSPDDETEGRIG